MCTLSERSRSLPEHTRTSPALMGWSQATWPRVGKQKAEPALVQQRVTKVLLSEDHDMIDAFPSDRAYQPFRIGFFAVATAARLVDREYPWRGCPGESLTIDPISIAQQVCWCLIPSAGFRELAGDPLGSRVYRHAHP